MTTSRRLAAVTLAAALSACALVAAPPASAGQGDDRAVVGGWYTSFLNRDSLADPSSQYWVDRLGVQAPGDVLWALAHTPERNEGQINSAYGYYLGRAVDADVTYWYDGVDSGRFPVEWVDQNVLASVQYARRHPTALVAAWYDVVLGRVPSPVEVDYWDARVAVVGRMGALRELWYTPEAVTHRIIFRYTSLLGRSPEPGEIAYWSPREVESEINVAVLIGATPEYRSLQYQP